MTNGTELPAIRLREIPGWTTYSVARLVTAGGSALTWIALPVLAYQLTSSPVWTALVVAFDAIPYLLLGLWAGRSADTRDRKVIIVAADVASGIALLGLFATWEFGVLEPWHLVVAAFVVQSGFVFGDAAHLGGLPTLVGRDRVMAANSLLYGYIGILECVVPALGGLALTAVSPVTLLAVDGASFLICAALIGTLPAPLSPPKSARDRARETPILRGLAYVWGDPLIRDTTLVNLVLSIGNGAFFALIVVWADAVHGVATDDVRLGLLYAAVSIGGVVGSFAVERLAELGCARTVIGALCLVAGASALAGAWWDWLPASFLMFAIFSGANLAAMVIGVSIRQSRAPSDQVALINTSGRMLALGIGFPLGALGAAGISRGLDSPTAGMSVAFALICMIWPLVGARKDDAVEAAASV